MNLLLPVLAVVLGLAALVWSAGRFVEGAAATARLLGVPPFLVGMVVVGFGTSAPELTVSALSALDGAPALALGNAYGSNICNIALILGVTALVRPVAVPRSAVVRELPILLVGTAASFAVLCNGAISRPDAWVLLAIFVFAFTISVLGSRNEAKDEPADDAAPLRPLAAAWRLAVGLAGLVLSSKALVWGAVELAQAIGVSDLVIGLTIVAIGTSLPELASSVAAARKGEDALAVGNVIGSNLFNTLAVVGLAAAIRPMEAIDPKILGRDLPWSFVLAAALLVVGLPWWRRGARDGRLVRPVGGLLLAAYVVYLLLLIATPAASNPPPLP